MESLGATSSPSLHQNVNGCTILLHERRLGRFGCMEFTIVKEKINLWQCRAIQMLSVCVGLLSICLCFHAVVGSVIFLFLSMINLYKCVWSIEKEVLLVTVPVGIQFTAVFRAGQQTTCFIPWHCVENVYIVEALSFHRVLYNLVVLTKNMEFKLGSKNSRLMPLFQGTKPRLHCLESIYRSLSSLLPQLALNPSSKKPDLNL